MTVSRDEIQTMARLRSLMETVDLTETMAYEGGVLAPVDIPTAPRPVDPNVDAMRSILERFHSVSGSLVSESRIDRELREALITEPTERGARVGSWEIVSKEDEGLKTYDVENVHTGEAIAKDLALYEAAQLLVRHLNEGRTINTQAVMEVLTLENEYVRSRTDAVHHRRKMVSERDENRRMIVESRYDEAKHRALAARERLKKLLG